MTRDTGKQDAGLQGLRSYLNKRPDLLLAIAKRHSTNTLLHPVPRPVSNTPAPSPSTLRVCIPPGSPTYDTLGIKVSTKARSTDIDIPLATRAKSVKDVKAMVEEMGEESLAHFAIPADPKVTTFLLPLFPTVLPIFPLALLIYLIVAPTTSETANFGRALVYQYIGKWIIPSAAWFAAACHLAVEPAVLVKKLHKHSVPFFPSLFYLLTVVLIGYGGIEALDRAVVRERIRLIHVHSANADSKKAQ
ncbi:hypothetical protein IAT38_000731 [Cryptococcus sp. DSM 104549]